MEYVDGSWYIALAFSLVFFIGGRLLAETAEPRGARRRMAAVFGVAALPSALLLLSALPIGLVRMPWYNTFRSINRVELLGALAAPFAGFATQAGGARAAGGHGDPDDDDFEPDVRQPLLLRVFKPLALPLALAYASACFVGPLARPLERGAPLAGGSWSDGVMLATGGATSGPAALATALASIGAIVEGEREIAVAVHATADGADIWQLARYAATKGCQWRYVGGVGEEGGMSGVPMPAVVQAVGAGQSERRGARRYIALLGQSDEGLVVGDPSVGMLTLSAGAFESRYRVIGPALALRASP